MKFLHTGDLHIGKTVNDFSMTADQKYILEQIGEIAVKEKADAIILAGDIYDRAIPPAEAVTLLNDFLTAMVRKGIAVFMISGNHDSPERISFAEEILEEEKVYIGGIYREEIKQVTWQDAYGKVTFVLLPFIKPATVGAGTNHEAVAELLGRTEAVKGTAPSGERFVLVTHYFVTHNGTAPELSESETTINVGGLDNVEDSLFDKFDYVALGHIHKMQRIGEGPVYYAGAPLAYSFSEAGNRKSVNLVEMKEKGDVEVQRIFLKPLHEMRKIKGKIEELIKEEVAEAADCKDYIQAELTNEEELIDPIGTLRAVYPNIMQIVLSKNEIDTGGNYVSRAEEKRKTIPELFESFYEMIRGERPDEERMGVIIEAAKKSEGEEVS